MRSSKFGALTLPTTGSKPMRNSFVNSAMEPNTSTIGCAKHLTTLPAENPPFQIACASKLERWRQCSCLWNFAGTNQRNATGVKPLSWTAEGAWRLIFVRHPRRYRSIFDENGPIPFAHLKDWIAVRTLPVGMNEHDRLRARRVLLLQPLTANVTSCRLNLTMDT